VLVLAISDMSKSQGDLGMKMTKEKVIKKDECPECGSSNVHFNEEKQQTVCRDCGVIFEELLPEEKKKFEEAREQE